MGEFLQFLAAHPILTALWLAVFGALIFTEFSRRMRGFREIGPQEATRLINREDAVLVDIRGPGDFLKQHIINARNVSLSKLDPEQKEIAALKDKAIIVYCNSGMTSLQAATRLSKNGFAQVYSLQGGIQGWMSENLPVSHGKK